ncbi:MAG: hypothetical protein J6L65_08525 [Lachnospiraceae bacterium]|nr:hypothetical protein [Lachnospiraceae bacterium]
MDTNKSIEELENDYWEEASFDSYNVVTCHKARKKPIKQLSCEEIRCLIGQKIGLKYMLPMAVDILRNEPFIDATYFEGDLLLILLRLDKNDWEYNQNELKCFTSILQSNRSQIEKCDVISNELLEKYI